jgi:hypothetical protein
MAKLRLISLAQPNALIGDEEIVIERAGGDDLRARMERTVAGGDDYR